VNKKEKHEVGKNKDIALLTRSSLLYGDSTSTRSLILAIPVLGSSIDLILSKKGQDFVIKRLDIFMSELNSRLEGLEEKIECNDEEAMFDFLQTVYENVTRTRSEEKLKRFAKLTSDCFVNGNDWDESEAAIRLISELNDTHINILKVSLSAKVPEASPFDNLRVFYLDTPNDTSEYTSLTAEFGGISKAAITMYCSELISKGLLKDEGIGRWSTQALELLVATDLTVWLLTKIDELSV